MKILLALPLVVLIIILFFVRPYRQRNLSKRRLADIAERSELKRISTVSTLLRLFGSSHSYGADYYFDDHYFYEMHEANEKRVPLADIIEVRRESTRVNNRSVWSVTWITQGQKKQARFLHNYTLFNKNFPQFLQAVKRANPNACVRELTLFSL